MLKGVEEGKGEEWVQGAGTGGCDPHLLPSGAVSFIMNTWLSEAHAGPWQTQAGAAGDQCLW